MEEPPQRTSFSGRLARMHPSLVATAAQQGGVFLRRQAAAVGYADGEIRALTRPGGPWLVLRRGAYIERTTWEALDRHVGQPLARDWAAHLTMRHQHTMSHDSAGRAQELSLLRPRRQLVHITRPGVGGSRTEHGVKHHLGHGLPWVRSFAGGLPVTPLARTAIDIAREHGVEAGVCAMDSALRRGASERDFARAFAAMGHFPHIRRARLALALADPGAENAGESMARLLVAESVPSADLQTQYPVLVQGRVVWLDLVVGCHAVEFDGRVKYLRQAEGGVAERPAGEVAWDEKERQRLVCAEGLGMSRIIWSDYWGGARDRARIRLRSEETLTRERFGTRRPAHLEAFAARMQEARLRRLQLSPAV